MNPIENVYDLLKYALLRIQILYIKKKADLLKIFFFEKISFNFFDQYQYL